MFTIPGGRSDAIAIFKLRKRNIVQAAAAVVNCGRNNTPVIGVTNGQEQMTAACAPEGIVTDVDQYRAHIRVLLDEVRSSEWTIVREVDNFGPPHANASLELIVGEAEQSIEIYSERLGRDLFDPLWFSNFLERAPRGRITLVVEHTDVFSDQNSVLHDLPRLKYDSRVEVRYLPADQLTQHVAVSDRRSARLELDHGQLKALVAFGYGELTTEAILRFNDVFARSLPMATSAGAVAAPAAI